MFTRIFEATDGFAYGKFLIGLFGEEHYYKPQMEGAIANSVLQQEGWDHNAFLLLDLSLPGCGAIFTQNPNSSASYDVDKSGVPHCWLYKEFLAWVYQRDLDTFDLWPAVVRFEPHPALRREAS